MTEPANPTQRRLWWLPDLKEALAFVLGSSMLVHQTAFAEEAQIILVLSGVALMGVLGSGFAQRALKRIVQDVGSPEDK